MKLPHLGLFFIGAATAAGIELFPVIRVQALTGECVNSSTSYAGGVCVPYEGFCHGVVGGSVFAPSADPNATIAAVELAMRLSVSDVRANAGALSPACILAIETVVCTGYLLGCESVEGGQAVPKLPCAASCDEMWSLCGAALNLYYQFLLVGRGLTALDSAYPYCAGHNFPQDPQPDDAFGGRDIPSLVGGYAIGLQGDARYPLGNYTYAETGFPVLNLACYDAIVISTPLNVDSQGCNHPQVEKDGQCVYACPFPIYESQDRETAVIVFAAPGVLGFVLCLFVFVDSFLEVLGSNDAERAFARLVGKRSAHAILFLSFPSVCNRRGGNDHSTTSRGGRDSAENHNNNDSSIVNPRDPNRQHDTSTTAGSEEKRKKKALRAATIYALLGSTLGIVFFCIGPLMSLLYGSSISCSHPDSFIVIPQITNESDPNRDVTTSACKTQRFAPFVLQAIFNLILYSIVRLTLAVRNVKLRTVRSRAAFNAGLIGYCLGVPLIAAIVSAWLDHLSSVAQTATIQLARQGLLCTFRFEDARTEFALTFLPFVVTGVLICLATYYVWKHLSALQKQVEVLTRNEPSPKAHPGSRSAGSLALALLVQRLAYLGLATFLTFIVLMSVSGGITDKLVRRILAPEDGSGIIWAGVIDVRTHQVYYGGYYLNFYACTNAKLPCVNCDDDIARANEARPQIAEWGIQLFCMSFVTVLFGGFYTRQIVSRWISEAHEGKGNVIARAIMSGDGGVAFWGGDEKENKNRNYQVQESSRYRASTLNEVKRASSPKDQVQPAAYMSGP